MLTCFEFYYQWVPDITHHMRDIPFLLVGTQMDLRNDEGTIKKLQKNKLTPISTDMGHRRAKELKASRYVECSALTQVTQCYLQVIH